MSFQRRCSSKCLVNQHLHEPESFRLPSCDEGLAISCHFFIGQVTGAFNARSARPMQRRVRTSAPTPASGALLSLVFWSESTVPISLCDPLRSHAVPRDSPSATRSMASFSTKDLHLFGQAPGQVLFFKRCSFVRKIWTRPFQPSPWMFLAGEVLVGKPAAAS